MSVCMHSQHITDSLHARCRSALVVAERAHLLRRSISTMLQQCFEAFYDGRSRTSDSETALVQRASCELQQTISVVIVGVDCLTCSCDERGYLLTQ